MKIKVRVIVSEGLMHEVIQPQWPTGMYTKQRTWEGITPTPNSRVAGGLNALPAYDPLHVRWKLKDGREYLLEYIDIRAIMREYFKTHDLKQQWQRENRPRAKVGDGRAILAHEIKDDTVIIKWYLQINSTPVDQRLTSTGAATKSPANPPLVLILKTNLKFANKENTT